MLGDANALEVRCARGDDGAPPRTAGGGGGKAARGGGGTTGTTGLGKTVGVGGADDITWVRRVKEDWALYWLAGSAGGEPLGAAMFDGRLVMDGVWRGLLRADAVTGRADGDPAMPLSLSKLCDEMKLRLLIPCARVWCVATITKHRRHKTQTQKQRTRRQINRTRAYVPHRYTFSYTNACNSSAVN